MRERERERGREKERRATYQSLIYHEYILFLIHYTDIVCVCVIYDSFIIAHHVRSN